MTEHDYFEAWWKKQNLGDPENYEMDRAYRTVALNGWLARSFLAVPTEALPPEHVEEVYLAVRIAAEGSDWKRDSGESLAAWIDRTLTRRSPQREPK